MEFATEIGQSLLIEVRRLQALLSERDAAIANFTRDQQMLTQTVEDRDAALTTLQESVDQFKDHNWTLEVQLQDLQKAHTELNDQHARSDAERLKTAKALAAAQSELEAQRVSLEQAHRQIDEEHARRELELAEMRKSLAGLKREKSDLQGALDQAKGDMAKSAARRSISGQIAKSRSRGGDLAGEADGADGLESAQEEEADDADVFGGGIMSPSRRGMFGTNMHLNVYDPSEDGSEPGSPGWPTSPPGIQRGGTKGEAEALRSSLAHAHKTIHTLKSALTREKEKVWQFALLRRCVLVD